MYEAVQPKDGTDVRIWHQAAPKYEATQTGPTQALTVVYCLWGLKEVWGGKGVTYHWVERKRVGKKGIS